MVKSESGESGMLSLERNIIKLPELRLESNISVEQALLNRRSVRSYENQPLTIAEVGQLLWAAQGITEKSRGFRTAPSAGATFPFAVYIVAGDVIGLTALHFGCPFYRARIVCCHQGFYFIYAHFCVFCHYFFLYFLADEFSF